MKEKRCIGLTRHLHRCHRIGDRLILCPDHRKQQLGWMLLLVLVIGGGIASYYSLTLTSANSLKKKSTPKEHQISILPGEDLTEKQRDVWATSLYALRKHHGVNPFIFDKKIFQSIELIGLFDMQREDALVKDLMRHHGFLTCNPSIHRSAVLDRRDKYDVEFKLDNPKMNLKDWTNWIRGMEDLFENHQFEHRPSFKYENPIDISLPYPPWREATKIINPIQKKGMISPTRIIIFENDITAMSDKNILLTIDGSKKGVTISGFIPFKSLDQDDIEKVSEIRMTITNKSGKMFTSQIHQTLAERFRVVFPAEFMPRQKRLLPGRYQLRIYINSVKVWDTEFRVDKAGRVDWGRYADRKAGIGGL